MLKDLAVTPAQAHERGGETELRFFTAMQAHNFGAPHWYHGIRHASRDDDRGGIDAYVTLDAGEVAVQIKSSHAGLHDHRQLYGPVHCIIVICPRWPIQVIRSKTFDLLYRWRRKMLQERHR